MLRSLFAAVIIAAAALSAATAAAQGSSGDKAAANALFDEGKRLFAAGDIAQACTKFEASLKVLDQLGTRLNLADCYDKAGRTASAWAEFREAGSLADRRGDKRAKFARDRAEALRPRLVKLAIVVPTAARLPGLAVKRNGVAVPAELFDTSVPVDPATYTVEATAAGYQPWSTKIEASTPGGELKLEVPKLEPAVVAKPTPPPRPAAPPAQAPAPAGPPTVATASPGTPSPAPPADDRALDDSARRRWHLISYAVGGAGLVGIGLGTLFGFEAKQKWDEAGGHCVNDVCDMRGLAINRDARSLGTRGTIIGGAGVALAAAAVVIYVLSPQAQPIAEHAGVQLLPRSGAAVTWTGRF